MLLVALVPADLQGELQTPSAQIPRTTLLRPDGSASCETAVYGDSALCVQWHLLLDARPWGFHPCSAGLASKPPIRRSHRRQHHTFTFLGHHSLTSSDYGSSKAFS